jgi:hypothetical protein
MARPKKETVDYFPHYCTHGKTLYVFERRYGNDGYAFWFKLLEMLGSTKGHYLDLSEEETFIFFQAKTRINEELCLEMFELLAKLEAIDRELWQEKRVVWCQNFVDGISDVYKNRRVEIPKKPSFYKHKTKKVKVSTSENPQSKVKETKVDKTSYLSISKQIEEFTEDKELNEVLKEFVEMREKIRKKLTNYAFYLILRKLSRLSANTNTQIEILNQSIQNSWQDVYALKTNNSSYQKEKKVKQTPDWYGDYEKQLENLPKEEKEMTQEEIDKIFEEAKELFG